MLPKNIERRNHMRVFVRLLGISLACVLIFKWRYRLLSIGLYIPFLRRLVVAREFKKIQKTTN